MSAELPIANFLRVAQEDLAGARLLATSGNRNAIYLCEQAAEKIIRAVLTSENLHGGTKHHLDELVDMLPDENPIKVRFREIEYLAAFATTYRYPTASGRIKVSPANKELEGGLVKVAAILTELAARFDVDLARPDAPARRPAPLR